MNNSDWLTHQILPGTNRYVSWLKSPLGWLLVAAIACVLVAMTLAPKMWLVFGVLTTLIALGILWPLIAIWAVSCELKFSRKRVTEGQPVQVTLLITNRFWFPIWGLSLERGFFTSDPDEPESSIAIALARIPAASTTEFDWEFVPPSRGIFPTENPELTCGFPFGLWFGKKEIAVAQELIVWPESFRLGSIPPASGQNQLVSETFTDRSGTVGDRIGLRPFREGDSLRLVRWAQTARFGQLIVSEQQSPSRQVVSLVIAPVISELAKSNEGLRDSDFEREVIEDCFRVGASICNEFHSHGYRVRCFVEKQEHLVDARGSSFRSFMDRLSRIQTSNLQSEVGAELKYVDSEAVFVVSNSTEVLRSVPGSNAQGILISNPTNEKPRSSELDAPVDAVAWIRLSSGSQLKFDFPRLWVKSCQSSWQVN